MARSDAKERRAKVRVGDWIRCTYGAYRGQIREVEQLFGVDSRGEPVVVTRYVRGPMGSKFQPRMAMGHKWEIVTPSELTEKATPAPAVSVASQVGAGVAGPLSGPLSDISRNLERIANALDSILAASNDVPEVLKAWGDPSPIVKINGQGFPPGQ